MSDASVTRPANDPLIDEVRAIRREISERYGNDVDRLCDHLQELERQHGEWVIAKELPEESVATSRAKDASH